MSCNLKIYCLESNLRYSAPVDYDRGGNNPVDKHGYHSHRNSIVGPGLYIVYS